MKANIHLFLSIILLVLSSLTHAVENEKTEERTITLKLNEVDIRAFIATVSEMTGKNFIIDPRVKGQVTIISSKPMNANKIYDVFLSVLKIHGFATIETGDVIKVIPNTSAKQDTTPIQLKNSPSPPKGDNLVTRVLQVKYADAAQLVPILRPLLPQYAHLAAHPNSNTLLITDSAANVDRIIDIVNSMDQANYRDVEIIPLTYSRADELLKILDSLNKNSLSKGKAATQTPNLISDKRTNSLILSGDTRWRESIRELVAQLDVPIDNDGLTEVIYLRHAIAKDMATILQGVGTQQIKSEEGKETAQSNLDIQADESTNSLIVTASPFIMKSLKRVIQQLDIRRAQVHIEAVIAEMQFDKSVQFGINWTTSTTGTGAAASSQLPLLGALATGLPTNAFSLGYLSTGNLRFLIKALANDTDTNILSIPSVVTLDNEEAQLHVGQNVPFITGSFTTNGTDATNPFQTIERHDVGVKLTVTPHINEGDTIRLKIVQEVSSVSPTANTNGIITNDRLIDTTVLVDSGEILVLGGLTDDTLNETVNKIPLLGDIPLLGELFTNRNTSYVKKNLMVFLRPEILRNANHSKKLTDLKYNDIRNKEMEAFGKGIQIMGKELPPLLPKRFDPTPKTDAEASTVAPSTTPKSSVLLPKGQLPDTLSAQPQKAARPNIKSTPLPSYRFSNTALYGDTDKHGVFYADDGVSPIPPPLKPNSHQKDPTSDTINQNE